MTQNGKKKTMERVVEWLEEEGSGKSLVNQKWDITPIEGTDIIMASTEGLPFSIGIDVTEKFVNLVIYTGIETAVLPNQDRLKLYRDLLLLNNDNEMMKLLLAGREETIGIRVDLDILTLGKMEFNDALSSLIIGAEALRTTLSSGVPGQTDENEQKAIEDIIASELESGKSKESIVKDLVSAGMPKEDATAIVKEIADKLNIEARDRYIS